MCHAGARQQGVCQQGLPGCARVVLEGELWRAAWDIFASAELNTLSQAIAADPTNKSYFSNRAAAYIAFDDPRVRPCACRGLDRPWCWS